MIVTKSKVATYLNCVDLKTHNKNDENITLKQNPQGEQTRAITSH